MKCPSARKAWQNEVGGLIFKVGVFLRDCGIHVGRIDMLIANYIQYVLKCTSLPFYCSALSKGKPSLLLSTLYAKRARRVWTNSYCACVAHVTLFVCTNQLQRGSHMTTRVMHAAPAMYYNA